MCKGVLAWNTTLPGFWHTLLLYVTVCLDLKNHVRLISTGTYRSGWSTFWKKQRIINGQRFGRCFSLHSLFYLCWTMRVEGVSSFQWTRPAFNRLHYDLSLECGSFCSRPYWRWKLFRGAHCASWGATCTHTLWPWRLRSWHCSVVGEQTWSYTRSQERTKDCGGCLGISGVSFRWSYHLSTQLGLPSQRHGRRVSVVVRCAHLRMPAEHLPISLWVRNVRANGYERNSVAWGVPGMCLCEGFFWLFIAAKGIFKRICQLMNDKLWSNICIPNKHCIFVGFQLPIISLDFETPLLGHNCQCPR